MLKVKIFHNPKEEDVNKFLKSVEGNFVGMTQSESTVKNTYTGEDNAVSEIMRSHSMLTILYEVQGTGGLKVK